MDFQTELAARLSPQLAAHIQGIDSDLEQLSRIPTSRFLEKALPNIGLIEMVSGADFAQFYDALYVSMFPNQLERERSDLIVERLNKEFSAQRSGLAPYRVLGLRDHAGKAIGAAQFSVLLLSDGKTTVPYLQYIYVREENRRQDMAEVLHMLLLAVATADARKLGRRDVPFTLFETEPAEHGIDHSSRVIATQRTMIHTRAGAVGVMLYGQHDTKLVSPHVQPGLEISDPPLSLVWAIRPSPLLHKTERSAVDISTTGPSLLAAYYQSLRDEGFPEANIRLAEGIVAKRCHNRNFISMPLCEIVLTKDDILNV